MRRRNPVARPVLVTWWLYVISATVAFVIIRYVVSGLEGEGVFTKSVAGAFNLLAYLIPGLLLMMAALSAFHAWRKSELLDSQTSIGSIRSLRWKDFELLVGEAYRRKGYTVEERGAGGPDGGVDLVLRKDGQRTYVQCKHWRAERVGVSIVRELYGVMAADGANRGIVVTSGGYTPDALDFARGNPLELIDGPRLVRLIGDVKRETGGLPSESEGMQCPQCGNTMILRTAKQGHTIGNQFWGCSRYPQCRATRPIEPN